MLAFDLIFVFDGILLRADPATLPAGNVAEGPGSASRLRGCGSQQDPGAGLDGRIQLHGFPIGGCGGDTTLKPGAPGWGCSVLVPDHLNSANWWLQNSHRDVDYSVGNIVNNIVITTCGARWALETPGDHSAKHMIF